ncbi:hypothetical protein SBA4_400005 [Candidatus Sulfopaludibacter sp. SbA4]|nr:hypothetical protein SBA4_400005 [Candidatus Sulfopaludibacter sp. SbA4]
MAATSQNATPGVCWWEGDLSAATFDARAKPLPRTILRVGDDRAGAGSNCAKAISGGVGCVTTVL